MSAPTLARAAVSSVTWTPRLTAVDERLGRLGVAEVGHGDRQPLAHAGDELEALRGERLAGPGLPAERVEQVVERAPGVEAGAPLVAGGQPLGRVAARRSRP